MSVLVNPAASSGVGLPTGNVGANASINAVTVTQANDVNWTRQNLEPFIGMTLTGQGVGTVNSGDLFNTVGSGVKVFIDITALSGTSPTLTINIQAKDPASGKYVTLLSSTALAAVATTTLTIGRGLVAAANSVLNDALPRTWRIQAVVAGTGPSVTATVGVDTIV